MINSYNKQHSFLGYQDSDRMWIYFLIILAACQIIRAHATLSAISSKLNTSLNWEKAKRRYDTWDRQLWSHLHCIALDYPENPSALDMYNYKTFYLNLDQVIPCKKCAVHYKEIMQNISIDRYLNSSMDLFRFTVNLHNVINQENNKSLVTFEDAIILYQNGSKCIGNHKTAPNTVQDIIDLLAPQNTDIQSGKKDNQHYTVYIVIGSVIIGLCLCGYWCERKRRQKRMMRPLLEIDEDDDMYFTHIIDMNDQFDSNDAKYFIP